MRGWRSNLTRAFLGVLRVIVVTFLAALLAFCIGLFFGIVGIVLVKMIRGNPNMDMALAYRHVALPMAAVALVVTFVVTLVSEVRRFRAARAARVPAPRTKAA